MAIYTEQVAYEHARIWAALEESRMIGYYDLKGLAVIEPA
jgi:hypothetical protein